MKKAKKQFVLVTRKDGKMAIVGKVLSYNGARKHLTLEWPLSGTFPPDCIEAPKGIKDAILFKLRATEQVKLYATKRGAISELKKIENLDNDVLMRAMEAHMRAGRDWLRDFGDRPVINY